MEVVNRKFNENRSADSLLKDAIKEDKPELVREILFHEKCFIDLASTCNIGMRHKLIESACTHTDRALAELLKMKGIAEERLSNI